MTTESLDWIVGIDLTPSSRGALKFSRWMHEHSAGHHRFHGVHAAQTATAQRYPGRGLPGEQALAHAEASVAAVQAAQAFDTVEVVLGEAAENTLRNECVNHRADGLVVGRAGPIEGWSLSSLGRVTRRILRSTPVPVMVVPPDYDWTPPERGPIVVGVTPRADCVEATLFAGSLSRTLDLEVVLVNVIPQASAIPMAAVDAGMAYSLALAHGDEQAASDALEAWLVAHDLAGLRLCTPRGRAAEQLLATAESEQATMVVCGSRQLSLGERVLLSSVGSDLAGRADRPVVVVPPR